MGLLEALGLTVQPLPQVATVGAGAGSPGAVRGAAVRAGGGGVAAPVDKEKASYDAARASVQNLLNALVAHPQQKKIKKQTGDITAKLAEADGDAAKSEFKLGKAKVEEARGMCVKTKKLAEDWAAYAKKRYDTLALIMAMKSADNADWADGQIAIVDAADAFAESDPAEFGEALKLLKTTEAAEQKPAIKGTVDLVRKHLNKTKSHGASVSAFAQPEIDRGAAFLAQAEKAFKDGEWALCQQTAMAGLDVLGPADRMAERRAKFETRRGATVKAIAPVRSSAVVQDRAAALDADVAKADALANHDTLEFEAAMTLLDDVTQRAKSLVSVAAAVASQGKEMSAADKEKAALDQHAAAARIATELAAVGQLLADAKAAATAASAGGDAAADWAAAVAGVKRARADMAVLRKLADSFGPAVAAEAAAQATPPDGAALKAALAKMRADGKAASKAPHAAAAAAEFKQFEDACAAADKALAAKDDATAAASIATAAAALVAARSIQTQHAHFATDLAGVEAQLKKIKALPNAKKIQATIDPLVAAVADAKAKDAAHDGPGALAALRTATDAAGKAIKADADRGAFDKRAAALGKRIAGTTDAAAKKAMQDAVVAATGQADALDFDAATAALKKIEVTLDKAKLDGLMKAAKPNIKAITDTAADMVRNGGEADVDDMIQHAPDGPDPKGLKAGVINAMAKGRYGIAFSSGKALDVNGDQVQSMKLCCDAFSKIPQDIVKNPSIKSISHIDNDAGSVGGGYDFDKGTIEMSGRPNTFDQEFGSKQKQQDPAGGPDVDQLPAVEENCKPVDENHIDFLAFAAAHEVGHGVDDKVLFMAKNQSKPEFGGWIVYGASVQPLADIIGADSGFYATPEQKKYVLDKLASKPAEAPEVTPGSPEEAALAKFDNWYAIATSADVFRRQPDCDKITIAATGYIYHEAYARNWVGYRADARLKGLTGYQFRAPAEWFAELYAGFRSGKLKPDHPSVDWLKKL